MFAKALQAAILIVAFFILWLFLEKVFGFHSSLSDLQLITSFVSYLLQALIMMIFAKKYARSTSKNGSVSSFVLMSTIFVVIAGTVVEIVFATLISPDFFGTCIEKEVNSGGNIELARKAYNVGTFAMNRMIFSGCAGVGVSIWAKIRLKD